MRAAAAAGLVLLLGLAGCGRPANTDGDLVNGWSLLSAAVYTPPTTGDCLTGGPFTAFERPDPLTMLPIGCDREHTAEVVTTTSLPDAATAPAWDSDPTRTAYAACDKAVSDYVGADWHQGRLFPYLSIPNEPAWHGGVRTAVCGVAEAADDLFAPRPRVGTARNAALPLNCVDLRGGDVTPEGFYKSVDAVVPVPCSEPHDTEFAGPWTAPAGAFPADPAQLNATVSKACFTLVAAFLGLSELQLYQRKDVYTFWNGLTRPQWQLGDRVAHCFLNVSTKTPLRSSLKGLGTKPL